MFMAFVVMTAVAAIAVVVLLTANKGVCRSLVVYISWIILMPHTVKEHVPGIVTVTFLISVTICVTNCVSGIVTVWKLVTC